MSPRSLLALVLADVDRSGAEVWRGRASHRYLDNDGQAVGHGQRVGDGGWVFIERVGRFEFSHTEPIVIASPSPGASAELVRDAFFRQVAPLVLQSRGFLTIHASAILTDRGVVGFMAPSGTGKSTTAAALARGGHELWTDDSLVIDLATDAEPSCLPLPFRVRLREESARFLELPARSETSLSWSVARVVPFTSRPLAALCLLDRVRGAEHVTLSPLTGADALQAVLANAYCFAQADPAARFLLFEAATRLLRRTRVISIAVPSDLTRLGALQSAVEKAIAQELTVDQR